MTLPVPHLDAGNRCVDAALTACVLASGSRGNAVYVSDGHTAVLVDAGLSGIEIQRRMAMRGLCPERLSAIVVTHEHADHIQGVGVLARRFHLPVFMTAKTHGAAESQIGRIDDLRVVACGTGFCIDTLELHPFSISHDAADPTGYTIARNNVKIGIATDLGMATAMVREHLKGCRGLILEANHDPEMLVNGPYPWPLKQRIQSRTGHLSNHDAGDLLQELVHDDLTHVCLAHLSEENNSPEKALEAVSRVRGTGHVQIQVARQDQSSELIHLL